MYYVENSCDSGANLIDLDTLELLNIPVEHARNYELTHWKENLFNINIPNVFFKFSTDRILAWYDLRFVEVNGVSCVYCAYIDDKKLHIKYADVRGMGNYTEEIIINNVCVVKKLKISNGVIDYGLCTRSQMQRRVVMG